MEALSDHYTWQSWWIRYDHRRRITRFRKRRSLFCCWDKRKLLLLCASDTEWSGSVPCPKVKWVRPRRLYPGPRGFLLFFICNFCDANRFLYFFYWHEALRAEKRKPLVATVGTSFSCHELLTVVSDWRTFLIALWVIWLDGLNIFGDESGVYMFTFMGMCFALSTDSLTREG